MPANVESMFYVRQVPWHGLGVRVQDAPSSKDALVMAGLDWEVQQKERRTEESTPVQGYYANVRSGRCWQNPGCRVGQIRSGAEQGGLCVHSCPRQLRGDHGFM